MQEISISIVKNVLKPELTKRVEEKAAEKADLDRTYCADSSCSKYILPQFIAEKVATCPVCKHKTCSLCKETTHEGACKENKYDMLLQLAKKQGWQRCKQCRTLIELKSGCSHITYVLSYPSSLPHIEYTDTILISCRCGFELCYTCGQRWKTCGCDVRDDNPMTPEENEEDVLIPFQTMPGSIEDGWPFPATGPVSAAAPTNDTSAATSSSAAPTDDAVAGPSSAAGTNQTSTFSMEFPELDDEIVARARERILQVAREGFHARGGCDHEAGWRYRREGPYFCDPCEESCGQFVMQCRECGLRTCHACWMELSRQR
ncbi:hypothetical protein ASPZODRAFT_133986 [Penicilliopsis zonata CBS 506.65]|uniref:IBR domain-containing protein n=1 Tax=Penicilliopsis zonata CBS 506.65 TaxID=1073090 RepID=A0A1L9SDP8_9EURO|nr:hypothetical protein ASPZODRAFT_133986 [Penicilliopsis zonata CBS 506.65]OJJ45340.1 hypothetical protein ASPZODRAFT_133986 [Penicilliopsis zonata CBS 506.65]